MIPCAFYAQLLDPLGDLLVECLRVVEAKPVCGLLRNPSEEIHRLQQRAPDVFGVVAGKSCPEILDHPGIRPLLNKATERPGLELRAPFHTSMPLDHPEERHLHAIVARVLGPPEFTSLQMFRCPDGTVPEARDLIKKSVLAGPNPRRHFARGRREP